jgi:hypothetical protein
VFGDGLKRQSGTGVIKPLVVGAIFCLPAYMPPFTAKPSQKRQGRSFGRAVAEIAAADAQTLQKFKNFQNGISHGIGNTERYNVL